MDMTREDCSMLDAEDPLASFRTRFLMPDGIIYLDGNSLGPLSRAARERLQQVIDSEWGQGLIGSWTEAGWMNLPTRVGTKIAQLVGAAPSEIIACDSTSVNLFKLLAAARALRAERRVLLTEVENFPTDNYIAEGFSQVSADPLALRRVPADEIVGTIDDETAVVLLTHVNYRTGGTHDMAAVTEAAHAKGALVLWDLSHSAGALPVDLNGCGSDFAAGCGYKYLNGGPGAPAWAFVASRLQSDITQPLTGWMGHRSPFEFADAYEPAAGIQRVLAGTPPVLGLSSLDAALDDILDAGIYRLRTKSVALCELFIDLVENRCAEMGLNLASPRAAAQRGSQISFHHENGYAVVRALLESKVVGDFRSPDIMRFGFAPLYTRFTDVWDAAEKLVEILEQGTWKELRFSLRSAVT
ncbi:MAG: kynureninase [Alphaproteobacteria bacterium]|nr:kynureninase [Alphaproteobacteria bacterium]